VAHSLRRCGIQTVDVAQVADWRRSADRIGLVATVLGIRAGTSRRSTEPMGLPGLFAVEVAFARSPTDLELLQDAHGSADPTRLGALLGYPECCVEWWCGRADPAGDPLCSWLAPQEVTCELAGGPITNPLLRSIGILATPHVACGSECARSRSVFPEWSNLVARGSELADALDTSLELLSWPMRWSALHGIAETKTPVLKVSSSTDPVLEERVLWQRGGRYPTASGVGLRFPFESPSRRPLTGSIAFQAASSVSLRSGS
jgi:hypothetical protein